MDGELGGGGESTWRRERERGLSERLELTAGVTSEKKEATLISHFFSVGAFLGFRGGKWRPRFLQIEKG